MKLTQEEYKRVQRTAECARISIQEIIRAALKKALR
jgi:hypothetical protein